MAVFDAQRNGFRSVCFYGGEPFTRPHILYEALTAVWNARLTPQIMTNGYWGKTEKKIEEIFAALEAASARSRNGRPSPLQLMISTDRFHTGTPVSSIARIVGAWVKRKDSNVDLNLSLGAVESGELGQLTERLLDEVDGLTPYSTHLSGGAPEQVQFCDKFVSFPADISAVDFIARLREEEMLEEYGYGILENNLDEPDGLKELLFLAKANGWLSFIQSPADAAAGIFRAGRFVRKKSIPLSGYDVRMTGRWAGQAADLGQVEKLGALHGRTSPDLRRHEHEETLMLGVDNLFYVHPGQLNGRIHPLGENTGASIRSVIGKVRKGDPIASVLLRQDPEPVLRAAERVLGRDHEVTQQVRRLQSAGLPYDAVLIGLHEPAVADEVLRNRQGRLRQWAARVGLIF